MLLAKSAVASCSIDGIAMHGFRITAETILVAVHLRDQIARLVVGSPIEAIQENSSVNHAGRNLGTELNGCRSLATNNGPDMGLTDTDNPAADPMAAVLKHPVLLTIQLLDDQEVVVLAPIKARQWRMFGQLANAFEIALQKTQLLPQHLACLPSGTLASFAITDKKTPSFLAIGARF